MIYTRKEERTRHALGRLVFHRKNLLIVGGVTAMSLICPKCRGAYENLAKCPKCGVVLSDLGAQKSVDMLAGFSARGKGNTGVRRAEEIPPLENRWYQSPAGRMVAGLMVALGLSYGLLQLTVTVLKARPEPLQPEVGLGVFFGLQAAALLIAGFLIGVGRRHGAGPGAIIGIFSGVAMLLALRSGMLAYLTVPFTSDLFTLGKPKEVVLLQGKVPVHLLTLYGLPVLHMLCGGIGGLMGRILFRPAPELIAGGAPRLITAGGPEPSAVGLKTHVVLPSNKPGEAPSMMGGSIAWIRCIFAIGFAIVGGSFGTKQIRQFFIEFTDGMFAITSSYQDFVTLGEFFALSIFIGGAIAGATKPNGLKQGLVVGVGAGLGMVPFLSTGEQANYIPFIVLSALFLAPLGGWFGTTLIPPPPPPRLARPMID
jgi:hypothetical protein